MSDPVLFVAADSCRPVPPFCQNYVAPEVIKGQYRPAPADMWSLGVVTYVLMSRKMPFDADSTERIQRNILCEP